MVAGAEDIILSSSEILSSEIDRRSKRYFDNNVQLDYHWSVQLLRYKHEEFSIMYFPTANLRYRKII